MKSLWTKVNEKDQYAIAIHNYQEEESLLRIKLTVGECVHILEENGDWYFGFTAKNRGLRGIFPKCYVKIMESTLDRSGPTEARVLKQPHIVHELTSVLREWGTIWKNLYMNHDENFKKIEKCMYDLMKYRSEILSGTLPVDELKRVKRLVTSLVDIGNKMLGLDMVVRDEQGNILNPELTSTIQLYKHHEIATARIQNTTLDPVNKKTPLPATQQLTHTLFVSLRNFTCRTTDDVELLLTLYDGREYRAFTESYVVRWNNNNNHPADSTQNLKALFTDLGSRDLKREKVYLVCYVVRLGGMELKEPDKEHKKNSRQSLAKPPPIADILRRPFGVAAIDITLYFANKLETDEDKQHFLPFYPCEKESLEGTLKRILANKELSQRDHKNQGLTCCFKLLHGDVKQVREENPHLVLGQVAMARKMGFPEVILPGDVRNDLYLTLVTGEFTKGSKTSDRNVEVTVRVCNEKGQMLQGVIMLGGGVAPQNEYRSVIYYHEDKPRWCETLKVAVPIEDFKGCHLKFTFKHRSSNETKDKNERPFALSYVQLMQDDGTTLPDTQHELCVYKVDHKKYDSSDLLYLTLPSRRSEVMESSKPSAGGLVLTNKDSFTIQTNVCSTKLTQNVELLGLLKWTSQPDSLDSSLSNLMKVDGEEVVKFLPDVLDALFNILMQNSESDRYDDMVFECLLYIIGLVSDHKYQHFQPVLDLYIQESFSATLAYNKLIIVLKHHVDNANNLDNQLSLKTMKSLQYIMKFIVKSRLLFSEHPMYEGKGQQQFELSLKQMLQSIAVMMCYNTDSSLTIQATCLRYLPSTIPDILQVFSATQLSSLLMDLINEMPAHRLAKSKMMCIRDIVHSQLFRDADCRAILLPVIVRRTRDLLESQEEQWRSRVHIRKPKSVAKLTKFLGTTLPFTTNADDVDNEVELCVSILSDIMDLLFAAPPGSTIRDVTQVMLTVLRTVIQSTIAMDRQSPLVGSLVAVMISIFRQMTAHHFEVYINHFLTPTDLLDFLMEILLVFKDLVSRPVYPNDWTDMIMLQNSVILKSLGFFSNTIRDFFSNFEHQVWNNFFHCAISFLTQPALQLDSFSANKRWRIISRYKDMRRETGFEIRRMWFNLGQHKIQFVPGLVGAFLEMTLIPETELRRATIPIFFDMMQCEFYAPRDLYAKITDNKRDNSNIRGSFNEFENEMIAKLDNLVEAGRGDEHYKDLFYEIMMDHCEKHSTMKEQGIRFVKIVTRLMERLLEYRSIITDDNKENRMSCTVNLLDFYSEINRKEMYIRYVNKLCDLHLDCDNFTEAAFTLQLHSKLLNWSDSLLQPLLRSHKYPACQTHRQLKEALYIDMINYFDKGKMWECALNVCKELMRQFEEEIYDYDQLSELLRRMSTFYDNIMRQLRPSPEYFRVAYYGRGFPAFLQNKVFIYRGKEFERLSDFQCRTLNQLPNAELMTKLTPPSDDILESPYQYVQINHVEPVMDVRKKRLSGKPINDKILKYHQVNDVQKFRFSRPFHRVEDGCEGDNEFATMWIERTELDTSYPLPGILRWFPVTKTDTFQITPLGNAIETMENANRQLRQLIVSYQHDSTLPLNPLSMKLNGIVDAAVMGGISKYEKAFFNEDYLKRHPEDSGGIQRLKELIATQVPLLEVGIKLHGDRAAPSLIPLQERLESCFSELRGHVEARYGKKTCDLKVEQVTMRRQFNSVPSSLMENNRLSSASFGSSEGSGSRVSVSSLTKAQVGSLKSFVSFSSTGTLTRASPSPSKKDKKRRQGATRRNSSKLSDKESVATPSSQWYTTTTPEVDVTLSNTTIPLATPVYELTQELTPTRPLRSEMEKEKRLSRPTSGQFQRLTIVNGSSRDSIGTTDSTNSEEDNTPPPLPVKVRESDYCNLPDDGPTVTSPASPQPPPTPVTPKPPLPLPAESGERSLPPTPPPKRPHLKAPLNMPLV